MSPVASATLRRKSFIMVKKKEVTGYVNFVNSISQAKDQLGRAHKGKDAFFTDDGFAVGISYCLAILEQQEQFDGLHWFRSVTEFYVIEKKRIVEEIEKERYNKKLQMQKSKNKTEEDEMSFDFVNTMQPSGKKN